MSALRSLSIVVLDLDKVQRWTYARKVNSSCILSIFTNSCKLEANVSVVQFTQIKIVEFQFDKTFHMNEKEQNCQNSKRTRVGKQNCSSFWTT